MKPLETTVREVLQQAIDSEVATRSLYLALADHADSNDTRAKLLDLAQRRGVGRLTRVRVNPKCSDETP